jgi:hypothetical protein
MPGASLIDPNTPGLMPGANTGGTNVAVPGGASPSGISLGGGTNPLLPTFPSGQNMPGNSSPMSGVTPSAFPANGTGTGAPTDANGGTPLSNTNLSQMLGFGTNGFPSEAQFNDSMHKLGIPAGIAGLLFNFLQNGAGFNPQVSQALIAGMQPGIKRGEADILEQFGTMGLGNSSAAAIGLGDYLSQVQLNEGQILANQYNQSVQNYLSVLMGVKPNPPKDLWSQIMGGVGTAGQAAGGVGQLLTGIAAV